MDDFGGGRQPTFFGDSYEVPDLPQIHRFEVPFSALTASLFDAFRSHQIYSPKVESSTSRNGRSIPASSGASILSAKKYARRWKPSKTGPWWALHRCSPP